jgi:two-component system sensor histidine kinase VanS
LGKQYFREFRHKIFRLHMAAALICAVAVLLLLFFVDSLFNGVIIDTVEKHWGLEAATWVMRHETGFVIAFIGLVIFASFFAIESFLLAKMDRIFRNIGTLFQEDDSFLTLDEDFALLEQDLNRLKQERMKSEQMMRQDTRKRFDIITYLAHDIKTPLASVIGYLCLLDETESLPEPVQKKYISLTLKKAYRLENLVNEFFELTRFNLGKVPLSKQSVCLSYMMEQLADEFYPMAEASKRTIRVDVPRELFICADADKIARVFNNILKNAIAYGDKNTEISIEARACENSPGKMTGQEAAPVPGVEIRICNRGQEIPGEQLERIFEQFYRLDHSRNSDTGGSGLGLAIAKEIVKEHGGRIWADSDGGATVFSVWLPDPAQGTKAEDGHELPVIP